MKTQEQIRREHIFKLMEIEKKAPRWIARLMAGFMRRKELKKWCDEKYKRPKEL